MTPPLIVLGGATVTGKTGLAIELAEALIAQGRVAEIISADSRQVYRCLDIATAKATPADRARVVHHGLDLADPDEAFTVAAFNAHVAGVLASLEARGGVAILAGGTGFYLRSVMQGLDTSSLPADPAVRAQVRADLETNGLEPTYARLVELAPSLAASIERSNPRRVERALEIAIIQGDAARPARTGYPGPMLALGLQVEPGEHASRITTRTRARFEGGLLDEARILRDRWDPTLQAFSAIGYREAWSVIDGQATVEAAIVADIERTIQFAKRQRTWFRSERSFEWLDVTVTDPRPAARAAMQAFLTAHG